MYSVENDSCLLKRIEGNNKKLAHNRKKLTCSQVTFIGYFKINVSFAYDQNQNIISLK